MWLLSAWDPCILHCVGGPSILHVWAQPSFFNTLQVPASERWFETNASALRWEMKASGRPLAQTCNLANWLPLLTDWEAANYNGYIAKFCTMYGVEREQELPDDCSCCVTQNPLHHAQHSRASDRALNTLLASRVKETLVYDHGEVVCHGISRDLSDCRFYGIPTFQR